jgi:hypothetical protein
VSEVWQHWEFNVQSGVCQITGKVAELKCLKVKCWEGWDSFSFCSFVLFVLSVFIPLKYHIFGLKIHLTKNSSFSPGITSFGI